MIQNKENINMQKTSYDYSKCPTCKGEGRIIVMKSDDVYTDIKVPYAEPCPTCNGGHDIKVEAVKKNASIPYTYYDSKYDSFMWNIYRDSEGNYVNLQKQHSIVDSFIKDFKKWDSKGYGLYIFSKMKGSGKSFLASCICNELMELYEIRTRYVKTSDLLSIAQSGDKDSLDEYKREPIKLLCNCKLLVLDDIGQKKTGTDWMSDILFRITDERMNQKLVTIFTSNLKIEELQIDDRVVDRINANSISIHLPEYSVRSEETYNKKIDFFKNIGLLNKQ